MRARERLLGGSQFGELRLDPFQLIRGVAGLGLHGRLGVTGLRLERGLTYIELGCPRTQCQLELGQCGLALAKSGLTRDEIDPRAARALPNGGDIVAGFARLGLRWGFRPGCPGVAMASLLRGHGGFALVELDRTSVERGA